MSEVITNYVYSLPKEKVTKEQLDIAVNSKIPGISLNLFPRGNSEIYKITDTLFYIQIVGSMYTCFQFVETAYENMIVSFKTYFNLLQELTGSETHIYKMIQGVVWSIRLTEIHDRFKETTFTFSKISTPRVYNISSVSPQSQIGQYLSLGGSKDDEISFFKRLISHSPILLPAPLENFEGKVEEAFKYVFMLGEGISGIQFIDIEPETI